MRSLGAYLVFAAVALRGAGLLWGDSRFGLVMFLLAAYGLALAFKTIAASGGAAIPGTDSKISRLWSGLYLIFQSVIVIFLLDRTIYQDFFNLLFIPLSLDAVAFFGRRLGYGWIVAFTVAILSVMQFSREGQLFGSAMGVLYSGICFLFGGFAWQVLKAESARAQNQRAFDELQTAHRQLQGYADQVANLAVEQERNRLARDLHDSVTQTVFSMNLAAQSASLLLDKNPAQASGQLTRLEELAVHALSEIQSLVSQLKPRSLADEGLLPALRRLADERAARDGLQVSLEIQGETALTETEVLGLYSIVHEALTNVVKHSRTRQAAVRLELKDNALSLEIEDRGHGFDPQTVESQHGHLGLAGMSERAAEMGWSFAVASGPNRGTKISVGQNQAGA